jgi:ferrous iron transport protein B
MSNLVASCHASEITQTTTRTGGPLIALLGNPNTGKSTLFNALTGLHQHTGNWPGKTVERKEGEIKQGHKQACLVDLPGIYSLTAVSAEEEVARDFIIEEKPQVVVLMLDGTNLERNLYLALQVLELTGRVVLAVNLMDQLERQGIKLDLAGLSAALDVPVMPIAAIKKQGIHELVEHIFRLSEGHLQTRPTPLDFGPELEPAISKLEQLLAGSEAHPRWLAIKLLEQDPAIIEKLRASGKTAPLELAEALIAECEDDPEILIAEKRFERITEITAKVVEQAPDVVTLTDRLDRIITHRVLGLPVLALTATLTLWAIYNIAGPVSEGIESFFQVLIDGARQLLGGLPWWLRGVLVDGVLVGLQQIFVFLFAVLVVFFLIYGFLEDVGYLARGAFVLDRLLRWLGLPGKAFMTLFASYGCNIPGVMGTRIIDNEPDRIVAAVVTPFIPCGARIAVITAIVPIFFGFGWEATLVTVFVFATSLLAVALVARLLKKTAFQNQSSTLVLELPDYRLPKLTNVLRTAATRTYSAMQKALVYFPPFAVVIWILFNFPAGVPQSETWGMQMGNLFEPLGHVLGIGGKDITGFLVAFPAKELSLLYLGLTYNVGDGGEGLNVLANLWSPLQAVAYLVFLTLYAPCLGTIVALAKEVGRKWAFRTVAICLTTGVAFTMIVYWGGTLLGLGR